MRTAEVLVLDATDDELSRIESVLEASPLPVRVVPAHVHALTSGVRETAAPAAILLCSSEPSRALSRIAPGKGDPPVVVLQRMPAHEEARPLIRLGASEVVSMSRLARLPEVLGRTIEDLTPKQQGSAELHALFNTVLATIEEAVIVTHARTREIVICNDAARRLFGHAPAELIGRTTEVLFPDHDSYLEFGHYLADALEKWGYCRTETVMRRRDGDEFEAEIHVTHLDTLFGLEGCVVGTVRDISRNRSADRAVHESMEQLQATLNSLQDVVLTVDPETRTILHCNPAVQRVFGYEPRDVIGGSTRQFFSDDETYEAFGAAYRDALERNSAFRTEVSVPHRDGHLVDVELTVTTLSSSLGWREGIVASIRDLTEQKQAREQARLAKSVISNSVEAVVIAGLDRRIISVNPAFERSTGYTAEEVIGRTPDLLRSGLQDQAFYDSIQQALARDGTWQGEIWHRRKDGEAFPAMASAAIVKDESGNPTHYIGLFTDISHHKNIQERLEYLVSYDPLTGLPNRRSFEQLARETTSLAMRRGETLAVLFLDLDHFKNVNETLGHETGDHLLRAVSERLNSALRESDTLARMGGDEFAIIALGLEGPETATTLAKRLLDQLKEPIRVAGHTLYANASIGISLLPEDGHDHQSLMQNADSALSRAKERGRNSYEFFSRDLNLRAAEALAMANSLHQALARNELLLHFQPRISAESGRILGAEALVRWQHPELGLIMPDQFIPIAEQSDLIVKLGKVVLERALTSLSRWHRAGIKGIGMSINLSAKQFDDPELVAHLRHRLSAHGIEPSEFELEVTESMLMDEPERVTDILRQLQAHGIRVAIDDFGTGYSSLNYLKQFPINGLKIDQSFVSGIPEDAGDVAITRAIIAVARSLDLRLVAEGVETEQQASFLRESGCQELQGFLYSPAVPEQAFLEMLRQGRVSPAGAPGTGTVGNETPGG